MDFLPLNLDFRGGNTAQGLGPVRGLVVAPYEVAAGITLPERQIGQVGPVRIDLGSVSKPGGDLLFATAAI